MRKSTYIGLALLFAVYLNFAFAENATQTSLEELINEAISSNPEIQKTRAQLKSAQAKVSGVRYLNDPLVGVEFAGEMRMYSITQQLPFPTKIFTTSQIANLEADRHEYSIEEKIQEIVSAVKIRYANLFLINKKIETAEKSIAFLKQLFYVSSQNYAVGNVSQTDVLRAQVELAIAEEKLLTIRDDRKIAEMQLNVLLNRELDAPFAAPQSLIIEAPPASLDSLYALAKNQHPVLRKYALQLKQASLLVSLAKQQYFPDFVAKYTQFEKDHNFTDQRYMVGLTVPLWFWGKQNRIVTEMKANLEIINKEYQTAENKILLSVRENSLRVDKNKRITALYRMSIIPQAEANLKSAFIAYEANKIDFLSLLESEKMLIQYELNYHQAQTDLFAAAAGLEQAVGRVFVYE